MRDSLEIIIADVKMLMESIGKRAQRHKFTFNGRKISWYPW